MAKPEWMPQRLYQWTKPRSLLLHLLFTLVAGGCLIAFWWQVHRAMQGNVLSYFYSVEWPAIAVVVGIGWWLLVHDTPEDIARRTEYHRRMRAASAEVVARTLPRSATALTVGSHEINGNALAAPSARAVTAGGDGSRLVEAELVPVRQASSELESVRQGSDTRLLQDEEEPDIAMDELSRYNRYLATLAVKGKPKTWRNPHGL